MNEQKHSTKRKHLKIEEPEKIGNYFTRPKDLDFISSGCTILDCVLGGGYPLGRICNIVGDKSTGKTLLAIEAIANFVDKYPDGLVWYAEAEAAFDKDYAETLGMPLDKVTFFEGDKSLYTVESFYEALKDATETSDDKPGLFILDSLDALSDTAERARGIDAGTFGASKPKKLSEIFRRLIQDIEKSRICVIIISQVRDNIGVVFGERHTRSGGKALDFYASQVLWLSQLKTLKKTIKGVERPVGLKIKARCKKNKIGLPLRQCEFQLHFGFGVESTLAGLTWLAEVKRLKRIGLEEPDFKALKVRWNVLDLEEYDKLTQQVDQAVLECWAEIETSFLPKRKKYR